jgi:hypothetical protein
MTEGLREQVTSWRGGDARNVGQFQDTRLDDVNLFIYVQIIVLHAPGNVTNRP